MLEVFLSIRLFLKKQKTDRLPKKGAAGKHTAARDS